MILENVWYSLCGHCNLAVMVFLITVAEHILFATNIGPCRSGQLNVGLSVK